MGNLQSSDNGPSSQRFDYINHNTGNIFNYYNLCNHIGIGRTGAVFHATDIKTDLPRAIKEFRKSKMNSETLEAFESEVRIIKSMDHPNIMKVYEVIESPYAYYLICELLEGNSLLDLILDLQVKPEDVPRYMEDILYALAYCHGEKTIHNDIRPDNLVFEDNGPTSKLKLIDFGLACSGENKGGKYGQIHFRAPETFRTGSELLKFEDRAKSDVWSAGVIFYILLTGKPLAKGSKEKEIKKTLKTFNVVESSDELVGVDTEALALLKDMLKIDPKERVSAKKALGSEYFKRYREDHRVNEADVQETVKNMTNFKSESVLNTKMMSLVAVHLLKKEEEMLKSKIFKALDTKFDGYIDRESLENAAGRYGFSPEDAKTIMDNTDLDKSDKLSYTEYLTSSLRWNEFLNVDMIDTVLGYFDVFRKGALTENELKKLLKGVRDEEWENFFKEVDSNNDRLISTVELQQYFLGIADSLCLQQEEKNKLP